MTDMAANFTDIGTYTPWLVSIIFYSLVGPLLAPILGTIIVVLFDASVTASGVPFVEALAVLGLHNEEYAFFFLMQSVEKILCSALNVLGVTCGATFSTSETDFWAYLGIDPTAPF